MNVMPVFEGAYVSAPNVDNPVDRNQPEIFPLLGALAGPIFGLGVKGAAIAAGVGSALGAIAGEPGSGSVTRTVDPEVPLSQDARYVYEWITNEQNADNWHAIHHLDIVKRGQGNRSFDNALRDYLNAFVTSQGGKDAWDDVMFGRNPDFNTAQGRALAVMRGIAVPETNLHLRLRPSTSTQPNTRPMANNPIYAPVPTSVPGAKKSDGTVRSWGQLVGLYALWAGILTVVFFLGRYLLRMISGGRRSSGSASSGGRRSGGKRRSKGASRAASSGSRPSGGGGSWTAVRDALKSGKNRKAVMKQYKGTAAMKEYMARMRSGQSVK